MAKGINIPLYTDVSSVVREGQKVPEMLDRVVDALDDVDRAGQQTSDELVDGLQDVGREARDTGDELDRQITDGAREAEGAGDRLERRFRDSLQAVQKESKSTGDDLGKHVSDGARKAEDGVSELKDEANSTAREAAASFDGSAESIGDAFQEVAANAFSGFGPAGAAAGLAAAVGLGVVTAQIQKAKEEAQEAAEEVAAMTGAMIEAGSVDLPGDAVNAKLEEFATNTEDGATKLTDLADAARRAGLDVGDYARAIAGDAEAAARLYDTIDRSQEDYLEGLREVRAQYGQNSKEAEDYAAAHTHEWHAQVLAREELDKGKDARDRAAESYELYNDATKDSTEKIEEQAAALDEQREAQEEANDAVRSAFDAQTDLAQQVADTTAQLEEHAKHGLTTSTTAGRENRDAMSALAESYVSAADAVRDAGGDQDDYNAKIAQGRDRIIDLAEELGLSADDAAALADELGLIPTDITAKVKVTDEGTADEVKRSVVDIFNDQVAASTVGVEADSGDLDSTSDDIDDAAQDRTATVRVQADRSAWDATIRDITSRTYYADIRPRVGKAVAQ